MAKMNQAPTRDRNVKQGLPSWLLWLLGTTVETQQPQPQRTQPANHQVQAAATPEIIHALAALEAAIAGGGDAQAIQTAFTTLSQAERQAHWQTGETVPFAEQRAAWEQSMDELLSQYRTDPALFAGLALLRRTLRQPPHQPLDTVEVSAHALYRTFIQEGNGDVIRFAQQVANTNTSEEITANQDLIVGIARMFGQQTATCVLPYIHRLKAEQAERERASVLGRDIETGQEVRITQAERVHAFACFGAIGSGKSTFALNLILQDIRQNLPVVLVEPHGDLTHAVLAGTPDSRLKDVVYLDLTDCATFPFGLNPFQCNNLQDAAAMAKTASFVQHTFERIWNLGPHTPLLAMVLRNVTRTLIENPGSSFSDIPLLLHDDVAREKLVNNVITLQTKQFWKQYNDMSPRERRDLLSSTENKIDSFLCEPLIANVLSQTQSTIDFGSFLNEGKIVLLNLSPQLEEISRLLGSLFLGLILMAAYQRASVPESERIQCHVYVDEWSRFCSDDLAVLISESRKFKVIIGGLFNQTLETISDSNRATALQAGTLVTFRVSGDDSRVLAGSYNSKPPLEIVGQQPVRAVVTDVISHLLRHGSPHPEVAKFAQTYLFNLDNYMKKPSQSNYPYYDASYDCYSERISLREATVHLGHKFINDSLYQCMTEQNPAIQIAPLALLVLAMAQGDNREFSLSYYLQIQSGPVHHLLKDFKDQAKRLGAASFLEPEEQAYFLRQCPDNKRYGWTKEAMRQLIIDFRHCITALAKDPLMTDTGIFQDIYRQRTYTDMAAQIANELSQQENYTARVKTLTGEYTIRTNPLPTLMTEEQLNARIGDIKRRMREQGLCRPAHEVEEEVRLRHEQLRQRNDSPPPTHTNRRRFRPRPPTVG